MEFVLTRTLESYAQNDDKYDKPEKPHKDAYWKEFKHRGCWCIKVESIERLLELLNEFEYPIVIAQKAWDSDRPSIEIYNDYRE